MCSSAVMQITQGIPPVRFSFHFWLICERWCDSSMMTQIMAKQVNPASPQSGDIDVATGAVTSRSHSGFVDLMLLKKCLCSSSLMWTILGLRHCQFVSQKTLDYQMALGNWTELAPYHWFKGKIAVFSSPNLASS